MSLDRFTDKQKIIDKVGVWNPVNKYTTEIQNSGLLVSYPKAMDMEAGIYSAEIHLYSKEGDNQYVAGRHDLPVVVEKGKIAINLQDIADTFQLRSGKFHVIYNFHRYLQHGVILPDENSEDYIEENDAFQHVPSSDQWSGDYENPLFYSVEFSEDRTEVYLRGIAGSPNYIKDTSKGYLALPGPTQHMRTQNLVLNFGQNNVYTIVNQARWEDEDGVIIKTLKPIDEDVVEGAAAWISEEYADPLSDDLEFSYDMDYGRFTLRRANFNADDKYNTITETNFKNWNSLLKSTTSTNQQIVDKIFSSSFADTTIGIDYSGFQNFIHFSSAKERLANFKYKLQLIEFYDTQLNTLNSATGTDNGALQSNVQLNQQRKDNVISGFDGFEKWLYYEPTASLFTHQSEYDAEHERGNPTRLEGGLLAADTYQLRPWPKYLSSANTGNNDGKNWVPHLSTSDIGKAWYNGFLVSASLYDELNLNALVTTIPEHIRQDTNNDQYELFVNMIGHHFDILYSYADALSKTYHPIEHPKLGHSKEKLYEIAKSLGWTLTNGNQAESLWQYKLGVNISGSYSQTGSIFTKANEEITTEVWRRIVNNLPYLLKTKGTARSIKALMNTYGIPNTLLSIREYGGPKVGEDVPTLIEDRFTYALQQNSAARISFPNSQINEHVDNDGYGMGRATGSIPVQTHEFRINPYDDIGGAYGAAGPERYNTFLMSYITGSSVGATSTDRHMMWALALQRKNISGSDNYARLHFAIGVSGSAASASCTEYLPIWDGDWWNVSLGYVNANDADDIYYINTGSTPNTTTYQVHVQKSSDFITGKVIHSSSLSLTPTVPNGDVETQDGLTEYWSHADRMDKEIWLGAGLADRTGFSGFRSSHRFGVRAALSASFNIPPSSGSSFPVTSNGGFPVEDTSFPLGYNLHQHGGYSGSLQEYRGWLEPYKKSTFDLHTMNPSSYVSSISPTSSYDTLVRHIPMGTEMIAVDRSTGDGLIISSSHPAVKDVRHFSFIVSEDGNPHGWSYSTASGFQTPDNIQRGNYEPVEETYYVQGVSLGGTLPKSQKIRFESNTLVRRLSRENSAERSAFDYASLDSNKLGLFYSVSDEINKDIFNQIGDIALDDFIGDPDTEYKIEYPDLTNFSREYWKKYSNRNDLNAYIRVFTQFDFSLFNQIKNLLPERVDDAMGLLIEPNALERAKVKITSPPSRTTPMYDLLLDDLQPSSSGLYEIYHMNITASPNLHGTETLYHTGSAGYVDNGNKYLFHVNTINTSSISNYCTKYIHTAPYYGYTSSFISYADTGSLLNQGVNPVQNFLNPGGGGAMIATSSGNYWHASGSNAIDWDAFNASGINSHKLYVMNRGASASAEHFLKIQNIDKDKTTPAIELGIKDSINAVQFDSKEDWVFDLGITTGSDGAAAHYVEEAVIRLKTQIVSYTHDDVRRIIHEQSDRIDLEDNGTIQAYGRISVRMNDIHMQPAQKRVGLVFAIENAKSNSQVVNRTYRINGATLLRYTKTHCHNLYGTHILEQRPSTLFKKKVLHYHSSSGAMDNYQNDRMRVISQSLNVRWNEVSKWVYSTSLDEASYRDDPNEMLDRTRYAGSKLTGPGINLQSGYAELGYSPIIEVWETNPNQIIYSDTPVMPEGGNLIVKGPLLDVAGQPVSPIPPPSRPPYNSNVSYI